AFSPGFLVPARRPWAAPGRTRGGRGRGSTGVTAAVTTVVLAPPVGVVLVLQHGGLVVRHPAHAGARGAAALRGATREEVDIPGLFVFGVGRRGRRRGRERQSRQLRGGLQPQVQVPLGPPLRHDGGLRHLAGALAELLGPCVIGVALPLPPLLPLPGLAEDDLVLLGLDVVVPRTGTLLPPEPVRPAEKSAPIWSRPVAPGCAGQDLSGTIDRSSFVEVTVRQERREGLVMFALPAVPRVGGLLGHPRSLRE